MSDHGPIGWWLESFERRGRTEIGWRRTGSKAVGRLRRIRKRNAKKKMKRLLKTVRTVRELIEGRNPPIDRCINGKVLPILIRCLGIDKNPTLQREAACALTNMVGGTSLQTRAVVSAGAVQLFLNLLNLLRPELCERAVWALGNIAGDGPELRDYLISVDFLPRLHYLIESTVPLTLIRRIAWVLVNLCRHAEVPPVPHVFNDIIIAIKSLIDHKDYNILLNTVWAIMYLSNTKNDQILDRVVDNGLLQKIIPLLSHEKSKVIIIALRAISNIASGNHKLMQTVLDAGVLRYLPTLLDHSEKKIIYEAIWFISYFTASVHHSHIQVVIDAGLIQTVIMHLSESEFKIRRLAMYAICNLVRSGNAKQVGYVMSTGVVAPLCDLLSCKDNEVILYVLESLKIMLKMTWLDICSFNPLTELIKECKGFDKIKKLQNHKNNKIIQIAFYIIDKFFSVKSAIPRQLPSQLKFNPATTNTQ